MTDLDNKQYDGDALESELANAQVPKHTSIETSAAYQGLSH